jgi:hypothetical protein
VAVMIVRVAPVPNSTNEPTGSAKLEIVPTRIRLPVPAKVVPSERKAAAPVREVERDTVDAWTANGIARDAIRRSFFIGILRLLLASG